MHESANTRLPARKCRYIFVGYFFNVALDYSFCSKDRPVSPLSESAMSQPQAVSRSPGTPTHIEFAQSPKVNIPILYYVKALIVWSCFNCTKIKEKRKRERVATI